MNSPKKDKRTPLQKEIDELIENLSEVSDDAETYDELIGRIERLKALQDEKTSKWEIVKTFAGPVASILGIGMILVAEVVFDKVVSSKALGFVLRGRV